MGDLRDQLKKAKLLSKKDAKRLAHEERVHRKQAGRKGLEQEQVERERELEAKRAAAREQDRARQAELEAERREHAERAACDEMLRSQVRSPQRGGTIRWFFELTDGGLPALMLQPSDLAQLNAGHLCVVRRGPAGTHTYGLLAAEHAQRVHRVAPERIVWSVPGALAAS